jgi:hypothetical protein
MFALTALKEHQLYLSLYFCLFMLCNVSVNPQKNVGARLAGASVTKTPTLLGVSRAAASKVMKTSSDKRNCG